MGAYSPAPIVPDAELEKMADIAIRPILAEMARQGHPFTGILYAGLMMTKDGPKFWNTTSVSETRNVSPC